jgi:tRNA-intron endonuclease
VYSALRGQGYTPKTGFKFGADFRVYESVESVNDLGHSAYLVQVLQASDEATAQEIALEVRLAHGVRKRTIFAVTTGTDVVNWLAVSRLTP